MRVRRADGYELDTEPDRLDLKVIHEWLSTDAYWARGRPFDTLAAAVAGSLNFCLYAPDDGAPVAFARVVTDHATFGWLCDVYVSRPVRGLGLGTWMVGQVKDHMVTLGVKRMVLATADAQGVYAKVGFEPLALPERWMEVDLRPGGRPMPTPEESSLPR